MTIREYFESVRKAAIYRFKDGGLGCHLCHMSVRGGGEPPHPDWCTARPGAIEGIECGIEWADWREYPAQYVFDVELERFPTDCCGRVTTIHEMESRPATNVQTRCREGHGCRAEVKR